MKTGYAMDKRVIDGNGYVTVTGNPISKEGVFPYLGSEIPGYPGDPNDIVMVYRPAEELSRQETIDTFKMMPFIDDHKWLGDEGVDPGTMPLSGMTGEQVYWEAPTLKANIRWFSLAMKEALESGKKQLSPAYKFDVYYEPGIFNGQAYTYVQRNLRGNHLALVDTGRTGQDVAVMDSAIGEKKMTLEEIIAALGKLDDVQRAAVVAALQALAKPTDDNPVEEVPATDAAETETDPATPADDNPAQAQDEVPDAKAQDALIQKLEARIKQLEGKGMDTGAIMKAIGERNELATRVSVHTGAFACDSMTVDQVAAYGINKLGLKNVPKGQEVATLNGYLTALGEKAPTIVAFAQDSAPKTSTVDKAIDDL